MKKTLVALAVTAFAASASAVTVFEKDGTKVDVNGRVAVALQNQTKDGNRADLTNQGSRVTFTANHKITEDLSGVMHTDIRFNNGSSFGNPATARLYAGLKSNQVGTLTFGRQLTNGDALGLSDFSNLYGGVNQVSGAGDRVVKFTSAEFNGFSFGADYRFGQSSRTFKNAATSESFDKFRNGYVLAAFYNGKVNDDLSFSLNAGLSNDKYDFVGEKSSERLAWTVATGFDYKNLSVGIDYTEAKDTGKNDRLIYIQDKGRGATAIGESKIRLIEVGAQYKFNDKISAHAEYINGRSQTADKSVKGTYNEFIVGSTYFFHKNVRTFIEGSTASLKVTGTESVRDNKIGVGFRVDF